MRFYRTNNIRFAAKSDGRRVLGLDAKGMHACHNTILWLLLQNSLSFYKAISLKSVQTMDFNPTLHYCIVFRLERERGERKRDKVRHLQRFTVARETVFLFILSQMFYNPLAQSTLWNSKTVNSHSFECFQWLKVTLLSRCKLCHIKPLSRKDGDNLTLGESQAPT